MLAAARFVELVPADLVPERQPSVVYRLRRPFGRNAHFQGDQHGL